MAEPTFDSGDVRTLLAELRTDRADQKAREKREAWTKYTSLSLVFVAVLAAIASQAAGKYSSRTLVELTQCTLHQAEASDQWSFYQAKSIKQNLAENAREGVARAAAANEAGAAAHLATLEGEIARYKTEKAEIKTKAEEYTRQRDAARQAADTAAAHGGGMGLVVSVYQIAIAVGSICLVTKKKPLWYVSLALALFATARMLAVLAH